MLNELFYMGYHCNDIGVDWAGQVDEDDDLTRDSENCGTCNYQCSEPLDSYPAVNLLVVVFLEVMVAEIVTSTFGWE